MPARLLDQILADPSGLSWALLWREGQEDVEVLLGEVEDVELLRDVPRPGDGAPVLALVPYRQIAERGFDVHDDGTPLRVLRATAYQRVSLDDLVNVLPQDAVAVDGERFSVSDDDYAATVERVIEDEIGQGEGANFVIRRDVVARTDADPATAALTWLRTLLVDERGAYWTFAVHTPGHTLVGATPERHVSVRDGRVWMNPISGTFRHPQEDPDGDRLRESFSAFVKDTKETEELFMVVDEEMKMMAQICSHGGRITGPYLKQMAHLTHTEYLLDGSSEADVRDVLRLTMFAPTVTGSPMENACSVIRRHEPDGRGYYSGVLALLDLDEEGGERLDAPILIRTAHVGDDGTITVSAGATLVRHSDPRSEVAETAAKARGVLAALGLRPRRSLGYDVQLASLPGVAEALASRNESLSPFWLSPQESRPDPELAGRRVLIVDAEDTWTQMLAHMVRHVGMVAEVRRWEQVTEVDVVDEELDLVLFGPGPGDPRDLTDGRVVRLRALLRARLEADLPVLAVCLSHQVLADLAGLQIAQLSPPNQGVQLPVDLWGQTRRIGFYNTFVARPPAGPASVAGRPLEVAVHEPDDAVVGLRGPGVATIQGHAESVLSRDGLVALHGLIRHALRPR